MVTCGVPHTSQPNSMYSKSTIETLEEGVKSA